MQTNKPSSDFTDVLVTDEISAIEAVKSAANELSITDEKNNLSVVSSNETDSGATYKLQQYYDSYPVYKATATLSVDENGNITELTSYFKEINKYSSTKAILSSDEVREILKNELSIDDSKKVGEIPMSSFISIDSTIYLYQCDNGKFITAYVVNYFTTTYIVRTDGKIIEMHNNAVSDSSVKCYNSDGSREFNGYYYTDNDYYKAYDCERNITIWTLQKKYNSKNKFKTAEELISDDEYFGNTENEKKQEYDTAVVFMNNISKIYDYYNDTFSETAYDNLLLCYNDAEDKGNNGFGGTAKVEAGDIGALYIGYNKDANDIDLLAHEYTHIVTSSKIKWADNAEQWKKEEDYEGALKEAYSDIFGEIITSKISGEEPDWVHGDRIIYAPMSNNYPANINDKEWKFTILQWVANGFKQGYGMDIGGGNITDYAHGFSTVISHSAYLMWNGIDEDESKKIDIDTLAEIWYNSLNIISESQNNKGDNLTAVTFDDCVSAVLTSARKLLKNGSITEKQYNCIIEAFNQVGILNENDLVDENKKEDNKIFETENETETKPTTTQKDNSLQNLQELLVNYYWIEYSGQLPENDLGIYEFKNDRTYIRYEGDISKDKSTWYVMEKDTYSLNKNELIISSVFFSGSLSLKYVKASKYIDKDFIDRSVKYLDYDNDYFFYDTEFIPTNPDAFAMYLIQSIAK